MLDSGIDSGPIIAQRSVGVLGDDNFMSLYVRVASMIPEMLQDLFTEILESGVLPVGTAQDDPIATAYRPPKTRDTLALRWQNSTRRLRS